MIIDSRLIDQSYFITVDPRVSGSYLLQGAVDGVNADGLTLNDVTLRYQYQGGRGNIHAFTWLTQVWLIAPGLL